MLESLAKLRTYDFVAALVAEGVWRLGGAVAGDQEQRNVEVVKLRIAFLQHITTLSGASILIVLALIQRAETAESLTDLATIVPFFALAALFS